MERAFAVELILYVSGVSGPSVRAAALLKKLLAEYPRELVKLEVCDLARDYPPHADENQIAFTPTLVRQRPEPRAWVIGTIDDPDIVRSLLASAGLESDRTL
jgi:hypothetical protein